MRLNVKVSFDEHCVVVVIRAFRLSGCQINNTYMQTKRTYSNVKVHIGIIMKEANKYSKNARWQVLNMFFPPHLQDTYTTFTRAHILLL